MIPNPPSVAEAIIESVRDYLKSAESQLRTIDPKLAPAAFSFYAGAATAARACLTYLGVDD